MMEEKDLIAGTLYTSQFSLLAKYAVQSGLTRDFAGIVRILTTAGVDGDFIRTDTPAHSFLPGSSPSLSRLS